jgi:hypothetical protein
LLAGMPRKMVMRSEVLLLSALALSGAISCEWLVTDIQSFGPDASLPERRSGSASDGSPLPIGRSPDGDGGSPGS